MFASRAIAFFLVKNDAYPRFRLFWLKCKERSSRRSLQRRALHHKATRGPTDSYNRNDCQIDSKLWETDRLPSLRARALKQLTDPPPWLVPSAYFLGHLSGVRSVSCLIPSQLESSRRVLHLINRGWKRGSFPHTLVALQSPLGPKSPNSVQCRQIQFRNSLDCCTHATCSLRVPYAVPESLHVMFCHIACLPVSACPIPFPFPASPRLRLLVSILAPSRDTRLCEVKLHSVNLLQAGKLKFFISYSHNQVRAS